MILETLAYLLSFTSLPILLWLSNPLLFLFQQRGGAQRKNSTTCQRGGKSGQVKSVTSAPSNSDENSLDLDPYAFTEDEDVSKKTEADGGGSVDDEEAPKLSEFAFTEDDEDDEDDVKPWFWNPAREAPKQSSGPGGQTNKPVPQKSLSTPNFLKSNDFKTNGTTSAAPSALTKMESDVKNVSCSLCGNPSMQCVHFCGKDQKRVAMSTYQTFDAFC